jgi:hypothetical protein
LEGLNPDYFHILEECASRAHFGFGQPIFEADSDADYFYLIDQGSVGLEMFVRGKGVITIQTIGAGEALGWSWLFSPYRRHFSARSHAATEAVAFAAPVLRHYAQVNKSFGYDLATPIRPYSDTRLRYGCGSARPMKSADRFFFRDLRSNRLRGLNRGQRDCVDDVIDRSSPR